MSAPHSADAPREPAEDALDTPREPLDPAHRLPSAADTAPTLTDCDGQQGRGTLSPAAVARWCAAMVLVGGAR